MTRSGKIGGPHLRAASVQTHALFEQHSRMVYGLCRALLRDLDDADDATQSTFIAAYQSLLAGNRVREPAAWLATIARNECAARSRSRMREPLPLPDADLVQVQGPDAELERIAVVAELRQAIAGLPQKQREAVVLRDLYGLPYTEVGAALGISLASVESLLFRARRSLRVSLKTLAGGALTVPIAVREGVAQALPALGAGGGGAASGAVGIGLVAKLASGPATIKAAAGLAAAVAAGSIAVAGVEHGGTVRPQHRANDAAAHVAQAPSTHQALAASAPTEVASGASTTHHDSGHQGSGSSGSNNAERRKRARRLERDRRDEAPAGQQRGGEGSDDGGVVVAAPAKHDAGQVAQAPSSSRPLLGQDRGAGADRGPGWWRYRVALGSRLRRRRPPARLGSDIGLERFERRRSGHAGGVRKLGPVR